jgi:hypothetical protein
MAAPRSRSAARAAALAMVALGIAILSHLLVAGRPSAVAGLIIAGSVLSGVAAREVLKDDALGWTLAMGHAGLTTLGLIAAHTVGIPGVRDVGWSIASIATVVCGGSALAIGGAARASSASRRSRRSPYGGTSGGQPPSGGR